MENTTAATTVSQISEFHQNLAGAAFRRCGRLLIAALKGIGAAWFDPMTSSAVWIGGIPAMWDVRK